MNIFICKSSKQLGEAAAAEAAMCIQEAIEAHGKARIILSTGASQLTMLDALVRQSIDWARVEMFHLDEYVGLPETHKASFRKYLRERFVEVVHPGRAHLVDGTPEGIAALTEALRAGPVDLGLIGVGENAHIAFNDPPADFDTNEAYIIVALDDRCKAQQVREGWFTSLEEVPSHAVSMTVRQILKCRRIISCVPFSVKADAVRDMLCEPVTNLIPATILKEHFCLSLYVDEDSFAKVNPSAILPGQPGYAIQTL